MAQKIDLRGAKINTVKIKGPKIKTKGEKHKDSIKKGSQHPVGKD